MSEQQPWPRRLMNVENVGDVTVVTFTVPKLLDEYLISTLRERFACLVRDEGRRKILLNFRGVELMSSVMLWGLLNLQRLLQSSHGRVVLCELNPTIRETFEIVKLDRLLPIYDEEQDALQSFEPSA
ncbi:MAG: STAS domain-containing protein [bacterium]|nr:STAS domain-containing protein [bacterium]